MKRRDFISGSASLVGVHLTSDVLLGASFAENQKKVVLITGTSSGFGQLMALSYARAGYKTFAGMRNIDTTNIDKATFLTDIASKEDLALEVVPLDVTDYEQAKATVESIISKESVIDVLINNAGIFVYSPMELVTPKLWQLQMTTNVFGPMNLVSLVMPHMRRRRSGLIIQVSSRVGRVVIPGISLYCASKFALETATEAAHYEATSQGVDFAIIQPTAYGTSINPNATKIFREITFPEFELHRPVGTGYFKDFIEQLDRDFTGIPSRDPQEVADLALRISETNRSERVLRYPIGDVWETEPLSEINTFSSDQQRNALTGRYEAWFRN